jgi:hypothetical protein
MKITSLLNNDKFNLFFSFILGIGLVCIFRPICTGNECNVEKPPSESDFDKYVYRMGGGKCYEFKSEIVNCPASGTIEAFRECVVGKKATETVRDEFARRDTPIKRCE